MRVRTLPVLVLLAAACRDPAGADVDAAPGAPDASPTDGPLGADAPDHPPHIVHLTPVDGAANVALGVTLSAWFSRRMNPLTFDASSFTLTRDGQPVAGAVIYDEDSQFAYFLPATPLARDATYRATIAGTVTDDHGVRLGADVTWSFRTAHHGWDGNVLVGQATRNSDFLATDDPDGVVHVAWRQSFDEFWSRRYVPGDGWQPAGPVSTTTGDASFPALVGEGGHMVATWGRDELYVRRYTPGVGWTAPVHINDRRLEELEDFQVAIDAAGNVTAYWLDYDRPEHVYTSRVRRLRIDGTLEDAVSYAAIAPRSGRPTLVAHGSRTELFWEQVEQVDGSQRSLWTSHDDGTGWTPPALVAPGPAGEVDTIADGSGDVRLVWSTYEGAGVDLTRRQVTVIEHDGAWSTPAEVSNGQIIWERELQREPNGVIHVIWSALGQPYSVWAARLVPGVGWEAPVRLDDETMFGQGPRTAVDEDGVVYALYQDQIWGRTVITARRHVLAEGWEPAAPIADLGRIGNTWVRVVPLRGGGAMALWCALDGVDQPCHLWASTYR